MEQDRQNSFLAFIAILQLDFLPAYSSQGQCHIQPIWDLSEAYLWIDMRNC
jgi:hypothetical protein